MSTVVEADAILKKIQWNLQSDHSQDQDLIASTTQLCAEFQQGDRQNACFICCF